MKVKSFEDDMSLITPRLTSTTSIQHIIKKSTSMKNNLPLSSTYRTT